MIESNKFKNNFSLSNGGSVFMNNCKALNFIDTTI